MDGDCALGRGVQRDEDFNLRVKVWGKGSKQQCRPVKVSINAERSSRGAKLSTWSDAQGEAVQHRVARAGRVGEHHLVDEW